jgi:4-aminobutyrate aminotransferase-like enzyme
LNGNTVLDLNASAAGLVLGYNHDDLVHARDSELYDRFVTHRVNANVVPPNDFADIIRENVMGAAPRGMN